MVLVVAVVGGGGGDKTRDKEGGTRHVARPSPYGKYLRVQKILLLANDPHGKAKVLDRIDDTSHVTRAVIEQVNIFVICHSSGGVGQSGGGRGT